MSEKSERSVIGSLPHSRPHRRSEKRAAPPRPPDAVSTEPEAAEQPVPQAEQPVPQVAEQPADQPERHPCAPTPGELVGTAVQAAAELAEIGLSAGARALRIALSRLPRP